MMHMTTDASGSYLSPFAGPKIRADVCCWAFAQANEKGSDSEGYGRLVSLDDDLSWSIGSFHLGEGKFCPWCGSQTPVRVHDDRA